MSKGSVHRLARGRSHGPAGRHQRDGGLPASANTLAHRLTAAHPRRTRTSASYSRPSRTPRRQPVRGAGSEPTPLNFHSAALWNSFREPSIASTVK
jgi:hypothetical protein